MNSFIIAWNVVKRTMGHRKGILLHFVIPVAVVSFLVGFFGQSPNGITEVAYMNADQGPVGSHLIRELQRNSGFRFTEAGKLEDLKEAVTSRKVQAALLIPEGFSESLRLGERMSVQQWELSATESTVSLRLTVGQMIEQVKVAEHILTAAGASPGELDNALLEMEKHRVQAKITDYRLYANPSLHLITGFLILFMMGLVHTAVAGILEDRKAMTMARMYAAPVRSFEIASGNFLGSFLLGIIQVVVVVLVTRYVVGFDYGVGLLPHLLVLACFLLAVMGLASSVAGAMRNVENVSALNAMVITPTCMLGGCFWPIGIMPEFLQKLAHFVPQSWAIDAMNRLASGGSIPGIALHLGVLLLFAVVLLGLGSVILKPNET
ncbi:ABC transporter permease [Paenibacillus silviterrae]|uniref:ABC transporter permease n=1 Tax=Paenibacillus silviterrae TaxID=3242194 RepID=UPI002542A70F|nr:ABC transporter permease [Paenibacillus chinjuensis]